MKTGVRATMIIQQSIIQAIRISCASIGDIIIVFQLIPITGIVLLVMLGIIAFISIWVNKPIYKRGKYYLQYA